ncbi:chromosome segregation protein SMC [Virgibacillus alimentarius]|uniref:chromosome segregation protein SMC n=1 Tax=Virgibacillus alimentarius TaxID=698769 RepID=UPI0004932FDD|nr:chromosome segregation protein SMC [Virgibacillus alimentarius]
MYLKRLESVGFKSFAERISVHFVPGVTAVVGPNGSGKSNITDAVRWVLGEQSAKSIRGSKMEDIIFQGSETRNALNIAEVTLLLDNSDHKLPLDYEEVSVTRRVYRSGESEFYINKQACRLKDIVDLFMDSGLGREAFSIISQGKVEEILSSKSEERRIIFEEAAGVLKYKQRKKKAEYKLSETQENLNRIEDIIYEIEQQIGPLYEQAQSAKEYKKLKERLKQEEIALLITEIEQLYERWQNLLAELEKDKESEIEKKTMIQQHEASLEKKRQDIQYLDNRIEALQTSLLTITQKLEQYEGKKQVFNEQLKHFSENKEKLILQKNETTTLIEKRKQLLSQEKNKLDMLQMERNKAKEQLNQLKNKLTVQKENISEQIEELKSDYIEYLNEQAAKRNEKQSIQQQLQQIKRKKDQQTKKFQDFIPLRESLTEQQKEVELLFSKTENKCLENEATIQQLKKELEIERNSFQESQKKLYKGYQYIEKLKSKKEMLEEMKTEFQGFYQGVKAILKARDRRTLKNIHGAVIELIDVPKTYITAIETILGGQTQYIVVNDDQAAREAISWLKKTKNGRATFLPLRSVQPRFLKKEALQTVENHPGFIGIAAHMIRTNESYQPVVNHLMGNVVVAKTLQDANAIAKRLMRRYRIVTLEGDVVNPGGSMSGGTRAKTNQSLFTRENDLQETIHKLKEFQKKIKDFEKDIEKQKQEINDKEQVLKQTEKILDTNREKLQDIRTQSSELQLKLASLNDSLALYDQDKKQFDKDREDLEIRDERLTKDLSEITHRINQVQEQINMLTDQKADFKENQEQLKQEYHQVQISLAEQEERVKNQREKTSTVRKQLSESEEQFGKYESDLKKLLSLEEMKETEEEIDMMIQSKKEEKEKTTNQIQQIRSERLERTQLIQDQERELKEESKIHEKIMEVIQQNEVKSNRLDVELENRLSHLQSEYTITYERAKQKYEKALDTDKSKNNVRKLKHSIERLGTVNLGAIEEYERISERYTFLEEQREDLVDAKETLYAVIGEMDEEMQRLFGETFTQIQVEFSIVFQELFGGGSAELKLTDPNNLLDTGVDIVAQPPGKKLKHLGLLSGGERALTAIALLFAILRVRPVPFCILDEVEAALDEANVVRFGKYIKMYSGHTQFIVITHRKGTMEEADVLYGVTMQESGVSRLVSVKLEDTDKLVKA